MSCKQKTCEVVEGFWALRDWQTTAVVLGKVQLPCLTTVPLQQKYYTQIRLALQFCSNFVNHQEFGALISFICCESWHFASQLSFETFQCH